MMGIVEVTQIGTFLTGNDPHRFKRLMVFPEATGVPFFCATCGREFSTGDTYITESDTARHCIGCIHYVASDVAKDSYLYASDSLSLECKVCGGETYATNEESDRQQQNQTAFRDGDVIECQDCGLKVTIRLEFE
jgi:DNA-directed RNA polymerase subunit RPC12/RpoP